MAVAVIGAIASGVAAGSTAIFWAGGGVSIFAGFSAGAFFKSIAMSAFTKVISGKSKKSGSDSGTSEATTKGITRQFRQSVVEQYAVYGECRVSGPIAFVSSTEKNQYLHMVILIAGHEIDSFQEVIVNDESIPLDYIDGSGNVTTGTYKDHLRIKFHLGATDQIADSELVSEVTEWTDAHRLRGIAYMYVRLKWNQDVYPSGIPNFSAWVKGKKILDPRDFSLAETRVTDDGFLRITEEGFIRSTEDETTVYTPKWSPNIALHCFDYLTTPEYKIGAQLYNIEDNTIDESTNVCDEFVTTKNLNVTVSSADASTDVLTLSGSTLTLFRGDRVQFGVTTIAGISTAQDYYVIPYQRIGTPRIKIAATFQDALDGVAINITSSGTGTIIKNAEPRYHGGGILSLADAPKNNMEVILTGMAGTCTKSGRRWYINAGAYKTPEIALDESDLHGALKIDACASKKDAFNKITGTYISQINNGNAADYPVVQSSTYQDDDLEIIDKKLDLSFTQRPNTCQRIAKQLMERDRQEIRFQGKFSIAAYKLKQGDTFYFTFEKNGWTNKVFEALIVELTTEDQNGVPVPYVNITAKETASECYDFTSADDEVSVDPAPNTDLPNPFLVQTVIRFGLTSVPVNTESGDRIFKILASWDEHENSFVREGGKFEIEYRLDGAASWNSLPVTSGSATSAELFQAGLDLLYDLRIRAYNSLGARSAWNEVSGFLVGSSLVSFSEDWENETETRNPDDWENDTATSEDWE